ncbi:glycosyltransferase [Paenibacillus chartarius]|uniref:Glycosyltransferase n=1 Tax=Paenibacillus chartarius TaxID=747481 RepID=A0ABV6DUW9_9BACL
MTVKVSVIIPVYNAGPYLEACIESLRKQTLQACEFIFVNDGSTDGSKAIIDRWKELDSRILLIDQSNQGVSMARNHGLERATGEYVGFVDADDTVEPDMFEVLYSSAKQTDCDVAFSNFRSEMGRHLVVTRYPFPVNTVLGSDFIDRELLPYFLKSDDLNTVCTKLFKRSVILRTGAAFPKNVALGEDGMFTMAFLAGADSALYVDYTGYYYREVAGSATRNLLSKDYFGRALEVYRQDVSGWIGDRVDHSHIRRLKSIRLIHSVKSYIHTYLAPSAEISFGSRYAYVRNMLNHDAVKEALPNYLEAMAGNLGRYDRWILKLMERKWTYGLVVLTAYSRFRSK